MGGLLGRLRVIRAVGSLDRRGFERWVFSFGREWIKAQGRSLSVRGTERICALGAGRKGQLGKWQLGRMRHKRLFVLMYFKLCALEEVTGVVRVQPVGSQPAGASAHAGFGKSPWAAHGVAGTPAGGSGRVLGQCPGLEFMLDGVERPVRRPKDSDRQKENCSGKRKRHSVENPAVTSQGRVRGSIRTFPGSVHDKKMSRSNPTAMGPGAARRPRTRDSKVVRLLESTRSCRAKTPGASRWMPLGKRSVMPSRACQ